MAVPASFLVLCACALGLCRVEAASETPSALDSSFCQSDGLKVVYPELDIDKCLIIPEDLNLREKVSTVWGAPRIHFTRAQKKKTYVLAMVDPDAPSRDNPTAAHWRHWLVVDVQGSDLRTGQIKGKTLTGYSPPTPPRSSGFHRYQFMLFEQPPDAQVTLSKRENSSLGKWDLQAFIKRFGMGEPVATVQFLTQNYKD